LFDAALAGGAQALGARDAGLLGRAGVSGGARAPGAGGAGVSGGAQAGASGTSGANPPGLQTPGLNVGALADIVSLDADHPALAERRDDEILDSWIFCAGRAAVDCVWRAGTKVVMNGRHQRRDELLARYRRTLEGLLA
jgi:cytosine/adenosine deaminase-related metal-dependent hydrolase